MKSLRLLGAFIAFLFAEKGTQQRRWRRVRRLALERMGKTWRKPRKPVMHIPV
jgi:hypothetical protein